MGLIKKKLHKECRIKESGLINKIEDFKSYLFFQYLNVFGFILVVLFSVLIRNTSGALHSLETPIRESLLKPRNFNPHPYGSIDYNFPVQHHEQQHRQSAIDLDKNSINEASDDYIDNNIYEIDTSPRFPARHPSNGIFSQGPHQFPQTLPPGQRNLPHPYAPLRYKNDEIHHAEASPIDDSLYHIPKKQYAFSYTVRDTHSGDDFSHTQQQKNGAVKGTYKVQLPDGRTQVVRYTADNGGYRAEVSYLIDKHAAPEQINHHPAKNDHQAAYVIGPPNYSYYRQIDPFNEVRIVESGALLPTATSQPPHLDINKEFFFGSDLNIEQRKSILAQATYVLSPKSTQISVAPTHHNVLYKGSSFK